MKLPKPRNDLGDLGPTWKGDAAQFSKVRELLKGAYRRAKMLERPDEERLDELTNRILDSVHGFVGTPEEVTKAYIGLMAEGGKERQLMRILFFDALRGERP